MREIKFRVWDIDNNEMIYSVDEDHDDIAWAINGGLAVIRFREDIDPDKEMYWAAPDQTIMQYTGLKDNTKWEQLTKVEQEGWLKGHRREEWNGKEIYEGDIVKDGHFIETIKWNNYRGMFYRYNQYGGGGTMKIKMGEVIGNIYENPNLLQNNHEDNKTK